MDYDSSHSTSTPSPVGLKETGLSSGRYSNCYYHHGRYCCSKICTIVVLLLFTTVSPNPNRLDMIISNSIIVKNSREKWSAGA